MKIKLVTLAFISALCLLPQSASALCCTCTGTETTSICINTSKTDCTTFAKESSNEAVKKLSCTGEASGCKSVASGGSCVAGPFEENAYKPVATSATPKADDEIRLIPVNLNIPIPGLAFATKVKTIEGKLPIPYLAQYISAAYKYLFGVAAIAAATMIVYGGFLYILASTGIQVRQGKKIIVDAVFGLIILSSAYTILETVNPDVLTLQALKVTPVMDESFKFMSQEGVGFKDSATAEINETKVAKEPITGTAPIIAEYKGEEVKINEVEEKGAKASQRLAAYCTQPGDRGKLTTYDEKIQALVRAVLGFHKICVVEGKCAYVRGGGTSLMSGKVTAGASDIPFLENFLKPKGIDLGWSSECATNWETLRAGFYKARSSSEYADYEYNGTKKCYGPIFEAYNKVLGDAMTENGLFGGDCGTTLLQIYACAGGKVGRGTGGSDTSLFNYINYARLSFDKNKSPGKDFVVWMASDINDFKAQAEKAGGLKFGDVIVAGSGGSQHNFMFTGGRADVPFELFEMGSSSEKSRINQGCPNLGGKIGTVCGMATHPQGDTEDYLTGVSRPLKRNWFPITVARPYNYQSCTTKADCEVGDVCLCTAKDPLKPVYETVCDAKNRCTQKVVGNKCSMQNICRNPRKKSTDAMYCTHDEMCPRGDVCILKANKSRCPKGAGNCFLNNCFSEDNLNPAE